MYAHHCFMRGLILVCLCLGGLVNIAYAKNLGVMGEVYPIKESDLLQDLQQQISAKKSEFQKQWSANMQQAMDRPAPLGLSKAKQCRTWFFNPAIKMPFTVRDQAGKAILTHNEAINPLYNYSLNEALLFYDADDVTQVRWAQKMSQTLKGHCKLILVGGSVNEQMQLFHQAVYFDQQGKLVERFQLQHVPAVITQEGKQLKISEIWLS